MSTLMSPSKSGARARVPRFAEAAVERARLTVVPSRSLGRTQAARTPFAVLVLALLAGGVVGLLMFNTHMQQSSFTATALQNEVNELTAREQSLDLELDELRDPQRLAAAAKELGMVAPAQPAFVRLSDGRVLGQPAPATSADAVRINPLPAQKPAAIKRRTIIVKAQSPARTDATTGTGATAGGEAPAAPGSPSASTSGDDTPAASTTETREGGRNGASTRNSAADSGATP
jgi:hypothetical protein